MCCQRTLEGVFTFQPFSLLSYSINLNDNRYECVAVQEDGEEVTTFVDLIVLFAPIIEQEEAYVRRRDGGREVRQKEDSKSHDNSKPISCPSVTNSIAGAHHLPSASSSSGAGLDKPNLTNRMVALSAQTHPEKGNILKSNTQVTWKREIC